jgi:hypothetical protein
MTRAALALCTVIAACASTPEAQPAKAPSTWQEVARGSLVAVSVERALYEEPASVHFFVHVRVENVARTDIAVDLRKEHEVFFPNQWGASSSTHRDAVDERRLLRLAPLDAAGRDAILADHRAGVFVTIPAGGAVEYYEAFNASGPRDVDAQARGYPFVLVVVDGFLRASDGTNVEALDAPREDAPREIAVQAPVRWASIPSGARIIAR